MDNTYVVVVESAQNFDTTDSPCLCEKCNYREDTFLQPCSEAEAKELCEFVNEACKRGNNRYDNYYDRVWAEDRRDLHHILGFSPQRFVAARARRVGDDLLDFRPLKFTRPVSSSVPEVLQRLHRLERGS